MWILYRLAFFFLTVVYLPKFIYDYCFKKKYRGCFLKRLGLVSKKFRQGSPTIWVHAVSVGEIKGASTLVKKLKEAYPLSTIIVSSITQTGHKEAKKILPSLDYHVYLPLDFKYIINKMLGSLKIDLVLLVETDLWPNFLRACKKRGASVVMVNGKLSERSFKRLSMAPFLSRWYYSTLDYFLVQDEIYKSRFVDLHVAPEKIKVVPNLKLDDVYEELDEESLLALREKLDIKDLSIVVGSSHEEEEKLILDQLVPLLDHYSQLKILVVPRHPERFDAVEQIIKKYNVPYKRFTSSGSCVGKKIILIDTMGQLRLLYQIATLAVVCGSFTTKVGGHNILEPLWYSTPCIYGPHMYTQDYFAKLVMKAKAGRQIEASELKSTVYELFNDDFKLKQMGRRGKDIFIKSAGGTQQTLDFIEKLLEKKKLKA